MSEFKKSLTILATVRDHLCPTLTFANYYASPIPVQFEGKASIAVLIGRGEVIDSDGTYQIWSPHLISMFDSKSGEFVLLNSFGGNSETESPKLGHALAPVAKLNPKYQNLQIKYCQTVDKVTAAMISRMPYEEIIANLETKFLEVEPSSLVPFLKSVLESRRM